VLLAVAAGLWLAVSSKGAARHAAPAVKAPAVPVKHAVTAHAAGTVQAVQHGHGVGFWSLAVAAVVLAIAVLVVAGLAVTERTARRRVLSGQVDSPAAVSSPLSAEVSTPPAVQDMPAVLDGDLSSDSSVVHLAEYLDRRRAAGGDAA